MQDDSHMEIWAFWPWTRCPAKLERKGNSAHWGQCDRKRKHEGLHALERGFDVVWFTTMVINVKPITPVCDCSAHNITEVGSFHANDCPAYNPDWWGM